MKKRLKIKLPKLPKISKATVKKLFVITAVLLTLALLFVGICNVIVIASAAGRTVTFDEASKLGDIDCIIVLGAFVKEDGSLSNVLDERVRMGARLYLNGASDRILMSGDHTRENYNEVGAMKAHAAEMGIDKNAIFTDHAGIDTYDTMYRARDVFKAKRVIIVTQKFHLSRAVFIARSLGLDAYGVACDEGYRYLNVITEAREIVARTKYIFDAIFKPKPKFLGEAIPIWGEASLSDG